MVWVISGEVWPIEDAAIRPSPGEAAVWPAGHPVGHCLGNRGPAGAVDPVAGIRRSADRVQDPDAGVTLTREGRRRVTDAAGDVPPETRA